MKDAHRYSVKLCLSDADDVQLIYNLSLFNSSLKLNNERSFDKVVCKASGLDHVWPLVIQCVLCPIRSHLIAFGVLTRPRHDLAYYSPNVILMRGSLVNRFSSA